MKLWKLENPDAEYNHHDGFVIAAASPAAARRIAQEHGGDETAGETAGEKVPFWTDSKKSRCTLLSVESRIRVAGVVLASYIGD